MQPRPVHQDRTAERAQSGRLLRLPLPESDTALVAALRAGRPDARDELVRRTGEDVERVLFRILGPDAELEDLMHDVFVVALTTLDQLRDPNALRAWVVSIAVRKAKKLIHRRTRWRFIRSVAPSDLPDREAPIASTEVSEALRSTYRVLERLPAEERIVFALRHVDGMRLSAIAEACGISLATTKRRLTRAHDRFVDLARGSDVLSAWLGTEELAP